MTLPSSFLFGAATAAHQIEGNNVASDFWRLENRPDSPLAERSGDACDSFERWREDIDLLAASGLNAYRFSIEWARIEPERDRFSRSAVAHYRRMVEYCHERGVEPVLTLHHFTSPAWFGAAGGFLAADADERFVRYLDELAPIIDAGVQTAFTFNEPNMLAVMATVRKGDAELLTGLGGAMPPADEAVTHAMIDIHGQARAALRASFPDLKTGWTVASQAVRALPGGQDRAAAYRQNIDGVFLEAARGDDVVGVQSYSRALFDENGFVQPSPGVRRNQMGWEFFPPAVGLALADAAEAVGPQTEIMVTENGVATLDDRERIEYTTGALAALGRAMADGIRVTGYFHWSLLDNYEWGSWKPRFGLIEVDRETFERKPKPSLAWLGGIARSGSLPAAPEEDR